MLDLTKLPEAVKYEGGVSRRLFLAYAASLSALPLLGRRATAARRANSFADDPFTVGVASGDPTERGVVLWTRLAPRPLEPGGGLSPENVEVTWEVARDDAMRDVVSRGTTVATPQLGHSVHVEVDNLAPDRWYWYRFRAGDAESPVGRARTMPAADATPTELRFAFASCQHYESGLYTAYEHMAKDELDLVFHLGDYIYEGAGEDGGVRKHVGMEIHSLDDYRIRHAQYKSDPLLQAMHARCPWMVTWDDHELDNDYANDISEEAGIDPAKFLQRRANAYQAYYEMMPLRSTSLPSGPNMQLYRKVSFGRLAEFLVLDTRQYRTDQPYGGDRHEIDDAAKSPDGTMLGAAQLEWTQKSLVESTARWNVLAQQVMMAMVGLVAGEDQGYSMEKWPGYAHERGRLIQFLADRQISNPVVLTGDIHSNWVNDLRVDDRQSVAPVIATEFVGTSLSSDGDGIETPRKLAATIAENPCVRFYNAERGYVRCTVTPASWRSDFRVVPYVTRPGAPVTTRASFVVESGQLGAKQA
ncbi:MAG: alkaline phosphatase D family protein [Planctomycetes bacterium]|nr:alkaline phosphatase D family protein [Planctomycetota bacterium]